MLKRPNFGVTRSKLIPYVFLLLLAFTVINTFYSLNNIQYLKDDARLVDYTKLVLTSLDTTYNDLIDAQSSYQYFIITGDVSNITLYNQQITAVTQDVVVLKKIGRDTSDTQNNINKLATRIIERIVLLQKGLDLRKNSGFDSAETFIASNTGITKMHEVKSQIIKIKSSEESLLQQRLSQQNNSYERLYGTVISAGILNLLLLAFAYLLIKRELDKRFELETRKNQFISMASHELKTPLTSMKIYMQILEREVKDIKKGKVLSHVKKINEQVSRLIGLVGDLLDVSRIQTGKLMFREEVFDINTLIDDVVDVLQNTTNKHKLQVKKELKEKVYGDRYRVYQVIINLLTNAIKYSPQGGKISIKTQSKENVAVISVRDEGIGIVENFQKQIFDPLYQIRDKENRQPGLGIGLYITSEIVKRHGGKIWLESKVGQGSTFFFTLPLKKTK